MKKLCAIFIVAPLFLCGCQEARLTYNPVTNEIGVGWSLDSYVEVQK